MTDEQVVGQVLMMAYPGDEPGPQVFEWIRDRGLGGIKIFGWNAADTDKLARSIAALQEAALGSGSAVPLLVATDQEGGWIRHVKGATTVTTGNMAIGASGLPYDAFRSAYIIGKELAALGVNMNFAPAVDLATRPKSRIMGPRAFSDDPAETAALGAAYARGLAEAGIIATAKHYPGHGATELDSHGVLPVIGVDAKTLWERELVPFRTLAAEGVPAVMSGHLSYPLVSGDALPASLSRFFMTDLLRGKLGFAGVAVTDDILMSGAEGGGGVAETCIMALEAGNDLVMMSALLSPGDPVWTGLLSAYENRPEFRARVREAALRVLELKLRHLRPRGKGAMLPDVAALPAKVPDPEAQSFLRGQAYRAATAVRSAGIPFRPAGRIVAAGPNADFIAAARTAYPQAKPFVFSAQAETRAKDFELTAFSYALRDAEAAVVCVANPAGMDFAEAAREAGVEVAVVSTQSPAPLARGAWIKAAVAVYGFAPASLEAAFAVLSGAAPANGRLPVKLVP